jgi:hypothetical protein
LESHIIFGGKGCKDVCLNDKMKNASMVFEIFDFQKAERKKMQIDTKMPCPSGKKRLASPILH